MRGIGRRWWLGAAALIALESVATPRVGETATLYGLAGGGGFLVRFDSATPGTIEDAVAITGRQAGERIAGIDFRPRTGQLFGLGVAADNATVRLYVINPSNGQTTLISAVSTLVTAGTFWAMAFNPTVDRVRIVNNANENFRMNPNNGARADVPTNDTDISPASSISAVAYDRSFDTGLAVANRTTAFGLSIATASLVTVGGINQSPSPNGGAVMNALPLGVTPSGDAGFDIDLDLDSQAYAALNVGTVNQLHAINLVTGAATLIGAVGDGNLGVGGLAVVPPTVIAVGADVGVGPRVRLLDGGSGAERLAFEAYDSKMKKGVRVAVGDVSGDSVPELITGPGKGVVAEVRVFDGVTGAPVVGPLASLVPFGPAFKGGVTVAAGDVNGDGSKDVIVGAGPKGGAALKVFSGATGGELLSIAAFAADSKGGVQVAAADFDLDGDAEIVVASGAGDPPRVRVFDGAGNPFTSAALPSFVNDFQPYGAQFKGGVFVAAGDLDGDGRPEIITGAGKGSLPEVAVFNGVNGGELGRFPAFEKGKSGVRVAVADVNGDGRYEILAAPGSGKGTAVRAYDGKTFAEVTRFPAFDAAFKKGVFVAGVRR